MSTKTWVGTDTGNEGDLNVAANWSPSGVPATTNDVRFPAGSANITDSLTALNNSTLGGALGAVIFEPGFSGTVADSTTNMQFTCTRFEFSGQGVAYIDLEASAIAPQVFATASATTGTRGLYLKGSAMTTLNVEAGFVGVAYRSGETSTVATVRCYGNSADVVIGSGVTLTTFYQMAGSSTVNCAATTITCYGGILHTDGTGAVTTINVRGGTVYPESTGTVTTINAIGGTTNLKQSGASRTVTTLSQDVSPQATSTVIYDPAVVTVTNLSAPSYPVQRTFTSPG